MAGRAAQAAAQAADLADPILGSPIGVVRTVGGPASHSHAASKPKVNLYEGSRLQRTVIVPNDIWYSLPPNYAAGGQPSHYIPGLSEADRELLFGALPQATSELLFDPERLATSQEAVTDQAKQVELMQRITDLRNASKKGIEVVNRERIIKEFGVNEKDTGNTAVQAALLTHQIRSLAQHLETNKRDIQNRRSLRLLIHKRAHILKYYKRTNVDAYDGLLADLGLARSAVEGELMVGM